MPIQSTGRMPWQRSLSPLSSRAYAPLMMTAELLSSWQPGSDSPRRITPVQATTHQGGNSLSQKTEISCNVSLSLTRASDKVQFSSEHRDSHLFVPAKSVRGVELQDGHMEVWTSNEVVGNWTDTLHWRSSSGQIATGESHNVGSHSQHKPLKSTHRTRYSHQHPRCELNDYFFF